MRNDRSGRSEPEVTTILEKLPLGQRLLDNIYFLLAAGLGIPFVLYTLWGVLELFHVPHA